MDVTQFAKPVCVLENTSSSEGSEEDSSNGSAEGFFLASEDSRSQYSGSTTPSTALPSSHNKLTKQVCLKWRVAWWQS